MTYPVVLQETPDIETSSDEYAARFSGKIGSWLLKVQEEATLQMLESYAGATILDIGGGHGQLTHALVQSGYQVTVLGSAEICKKRIQQVIDERRCSFQVGNILDLPYVQNSFDVVVSYRMISHVSHWKRFIAEVTRVARTAAILDYPAVRSMNWLAPPLFQLKRLVEGNTRPFTLFRESELIEVFQSRGFVLATRWPEFFLPMVAHRLFRSPGLSATLEGIFGVMGLTALCGSPVIVKMVRKGA